MKKQNMNASVAHILDNPQKDWRSIVRCSNGNIRVAYRELDVDWKKFNKEDFLFAHVTILSSCQVQDNGYQIVQPCDELVNANGNAWTNQVIQHAYKTFVGGDVFRNHIQLPAMSKGKILDAVLRPVTHKGKNGKQAKVFMCDLLTATSRKHQDLIEKIQSGKLSTLSMGVVCSHTQCSICGRIIGEDDKNCQHLERHLGQYLQANGQKRKCAQLIGAIDPNTGQYIPDSCHFIQASWVDQPAFKGAVVNYFIQDQEMKIERQNRVSQLNNLTQSMFMSLRVADTPSKMALDLAKEQYLIRKMALNIIK